MKTIIKLYLALIALLSIGLVLGLAACSDGDDSSSGGGSGGETELIAYTRNTTTSDGVPKTETLTFYSDNTFTLHEATAEYDLIVCDGTYKGDPTKDGQVLATIKRMVNKFKMMIAHFDGAGVVTNEHAPLEPCEEKDMNCTVSGNNLYDDEPSPMTKVGSSN